MTDSLFKIGDRVRMTEKGFESVRGLKSREGEVIGIQNDSPVWPIDVLFDGHNPEEYCPCDEKELIFLRRGEG